MTHKQSCKQPPVDYPAAVFHSTVGNTFEPHVSGQEVSSAST